MKRIGIIVRNCVKTSPVIYSREISLYPEEQAAEGLQDWEENDELGSVKDGGPPPWKRGIWTGKGEQQNATNMSEGGNEVA